MRRFIDPPRLWLALARTGRAVAAFWAMALAGWLVRVVSPPRDGEPPPVSPAEWPVVLIATALLAIVPVVLWLLHRPIRAGRPALVRPLAVSALVAGSILTAGGLLIVFLVLYAYTPAGGGGDRPFTPDRRVAPDGADAWDLPAPTPAARRLRAGLRVQALDHSGGWVRVLCPDGWVGWVDGRSLRGSSAPGPGSPSRA